MNSRKFLKKISVCALTLVLALSMAACGSKDEGERKKDGVEAADEYNEYIYDKQYENKRYYFSQGYPDDWQIKEGEDQVALSTVECPDFSDVELITQFSKGNAKYSVYCMKHSFMATSPSLLASGILGINEDYNFTFNEYFNEGAPRDNYVPDTVENEEALKEMVVTHKNNDLSFTQVTYTFTVDGINWKGAMNLTTSNEGFFLITIESTEAEWASNFELMNEKMLADFHLKGYETKK